MIYVYALFDPRQPLHVRYVGKTTDMVSRLQNHISQAKREAGCHRLLWMRKLLTAGVLPCQRLLEMVEGASWQEAERRWIRDLRAAGHDLVNGTNGGEGGCAWIGRTMPPEVRAKIRNAKLGKRHSLETRAKMSASRMGKSPSIETRAKLRAALLGKTSPRFAEVVMGSNGWPRL